MKISKLNIYCLKDFNNNKISLGIKAIISFFEEIIKTVSKTEPKRLIIIFIIIKKNIILFNYSKLNKMSTNNKIKKIIIKPTTTQIEIHENKFGSNPERKLFQIMERDFKVLCGYKINIIPDKQNFAKILGIASIKDTILHQKHITNGMECDFILFSPDAEIDNIPKNLSLKELKDRCAIHIHEHDGYTLHQTEPKKIKNDLFRTFICQNLNKIPLSRSISIPNDKDGKNDEDSLIKWIKEIHEGNIHQTLSKELHEPVPIIDFGSKFNEKINDYHKKRKGHSTAYYLDDETILNFPPLPRIEASEDEINSFCLKLQNNTARKETKNEIIRADAEQKLINNNYNNNNIKRQNKTTVEAWRENHLTWVIPLFVGSAIGATSIYKYKENIKDTFSKIYCVIKNKTMSIAKLIN